MSENIDILLKQLKLKQINKDPITFEIVYNNKYKGITTIIKNDDKIEMCSTIELRTETGTEIGTGTELGTGTETGTEPGTETETESGTHFYFIIIFNYSCYAFIFIIINNLKCY